MSRGREQHQRQSEAAAGGAVAVPRRGRWFDDDDDEQTTTAAAGWRCRSCAAAVIADCVALGCCPCAVVSLLGLALVKAPLVVGRRCVSRFRRRRRLLLHKKRVRDVAATACDREKGVKPEIAHGVGAAPPNAAEAVASAPARGAEEELAWLEEMYRVGHWGFGRVSFSGRTP